MLAEPVAPTVDTLTWDDACTIGEQAWEDAEKSKWILGDIASIVAHKWQGKDTIKNFANSIGMHDNAKRLYDYVSVATHYPPDVREHFPNTTWSAFRECSRHGLTLEKSIDALEQHGDKPVAAIRRAILGTVAPKPVPPVPVGEFVTEGWLLAGICSKTEAQAFDLKARYRVVVYEYTASVAVDNLTTES